MQNTIQYCKETTFRHTLVKIELTEFQKTIKKKIKREIKIRAEKKIREIIESFWSPSRVEKNRVNE